MHVNLKYIYIYISGIFKLKFFFFFFQVKLKLILSIHILRNHVHPANIFRTKQRLERITIISC
jgi:hypothetical protein